VIDSVANAPSHTSLPDPISRPASTGAKGMEILNDTDGKIAVEMTAFEAFIRRAALR